MCCCNVSKLFVHWQLFYWSFLSIECAHGFVCFNCILPQEQKLTLQSRSKDSHLNQLGEVEKRFSALSRQCAMVKQAHEKLEQNGNEWMDRWIHTQKKTYKHVPLVTDRRFTNYTKLQRHNCSNNILHKTCSTSVCAAECYPQLQPQHEHEGQR